jgi:uncharacterized membrane protein
VTFVICILLYCLAMNRLDRRHFAELERIKDQATAVPTNEATEQ